MRDLAARLRDIVRQDPRPGRPPGAGAAGMAPAGRELTYVPDPEAPPADAAGLSALGGRPVDAGGACIAIDRVYPADRSYGRRAIEALAPARHAPLSLFDRRVAPGSDWWRRVVFFDIETTGLSGGAGTLAFLAGCGWFEDEGFRVRQFFLAGPSGERALLDALATELADASLIVTYNGRTFDVPFMEMRWAFHRAACPTDDVPHVDMLPAARRLWRRRDAVGDDGGCSLTAIERAVLGVHRHGDVPSFEIPARYFHFLRTGDASGVAPVLEHNRYDLVSLAALMSHALWLAGEGPEACREPAEQLALGQLYERAGDIPAARHAFEVAAASADRGSRREALARLAAMHRRGRQHDEAARAWEQLLETKGTGTSTDASLDRRAIEALAIHHEHRRKDLAGARRLAEALGREASGRLRREADHRLRRIERKLKRETGFPEL
jgi:uncharacterized protein